MANTSDFLMLKEDHTLGNLLAEHLKMHPKVLMAGYKGKLALAVLVPSARSLTLLVAHPNVPEVLLRVQTDGTITPKEVLVDVCKQLVATLGHLSREFTREYELRRMATAGEQQQQGGNGAY